MGKAKTAIERRFAEGAGLGAQRFGQTTAKRWLPAGEGTLAAGDLLWRCSRLCRGDAYPRFTSRPSRRAELVSRKNARLLPLIVHNPTRHAAQIRQFEAQPFEQMNCERPKYPDDDLPVLWRGQALQFPLDQTRLPRCGACCTSGIGTNAETQRTATCWRPLRVAASAGKPRSGRNEAVWAAALFFRILPSSVSMAFGASSAQPRGTSSSKAAFAYAASGRDTKEATS